MKKKYFAILLALLLSISLAACGNVDSDVDLEPAEIQQESPLFVP